MAVAQLRGDLDVYGLRRAVAELAAFVVDYFRCLDQQPLELAVYLEQKALEKENNR